MPLSIFVVGIRAVMARRAPVRCDKSRAGCFRTSSAAPIRLRSG